MRVVALVKRFEYTARFQVVGLVLNLLLLMLSIAIFNFGTIFIFFLV
jgi:hypothetical protein